jgi:hypothetical protein
VKPDRRDSINCLCSACGVVLTEPCIETLYVGASGTCVRGSARMPSPLCIEQRLISDAARGKDAFGVLLAAARAARTGRAVV